MLRYCGRVRAFKCHVPPPLTPSHRHFCLFLIFSQTICNAIQAYVHYCSCVHVFFSLVKQTVLDDSTKTLKIIFFRLTWCVLFLQLYCNYVF